MSEELTITKITFDNDSVYSIFGGNFHLDPQLQCLLTDNEIVDQLILTQGLRIKEINDVSAEGILNKLLEENRKRIKKITLSNGEVYSIFDEGSIHLDPQFHRLMTGNQIVDQAILDGHLYITSIDDVPVEESIDNVLVGVESIFIDPITGQQFTSNEIKKRSTDNLLKDIGGISSSINNNILSLKIGK